MIAESCAFLLISLLACIFLFTGGQTLWSWAKRISWKCESKIRPWSYSLVATPCDFGQESFCESQSKYLWFSVDNWLCETFFSQINHPMKTIVVWIDTTWNNFEYIKALWNCFELGYDIFEMSPGVCFIRNICQHQYSKLYTGTDIIQL